MSTTRKRNHLNLAAISDSTFAIFLAVFAVAVALLIYGYEIANFSLSIDEEIKRWYSTENWQAWIAQGRWGMGLLIYLLPEGLSSMPFLPTFLFAIGLAVSGVLFSTVMTNSRAEAIVFTGVFVTSPIFLHVAEFNTISWGISIGLILTAMATAHFDRGRAGNYIVAGACVAVSMAIYQALLILYLTVILLVWIRKEWDAGRSRSNQFLERNLPLAGNIFKTLLITVGIYVLMDRLLKKLCGSHSDYLDNWVSLSAYTTKGGLDALVKVMEKTKGLFLGTDPSFLDAGRASLLLIWFGSVVLLWKQFQSGITVVTRLSVLVLSMAALLVSISLILLSAGNIPIRALISFPLLYATLSSVAFQNRWGRKVLWMTFFVAIFANTYIANSLFYADHIVRQRDLVMATRIIDRVEDIGRSAFGENVPIAFLGGWEHERGGPALRVEIFGDSFFEHEGGNPYRIAAYFRLLGCRGLVPIKLNDIVDELDEFKLHPSWPAKGAVFLSKRAVIVKLGELSYQQSLDLHKQ